MAKKVTIVGVGLGNEKFLTAEARAALTSAKKVYTTARIGMELQEILQEIVSFKVSEIVPMVRQNDEDAVVMVSGDTGFYSLAKTITRGLSKEIDAGEIEVEILNGISSMQYFFCKNPKRLRRCCARISARTQDKFGGTGDLQQACVCTDGWRIQSGRYLQRTLRCRDGFFDDHCGRESW